MSDRTSPDEHRPNPAAKHGDLELERILRLLEGDQARSMSVAALREHGVKAPAQAVYALQLAGYAIDRVSSTDPSGRQTLGYRLRGSPAAPPDSSVGSREVGCDDA